MCCFCFFKAEAGIRDYKVPGVQPCALPICRGGDAAAGTRPRVRAEELVGRLGADAWARACGSIPVAAFTITKLLWLERAEERGGGEEGGSRWWPGHLKKKNR